MLLRGATSLSAAAARPAVALATAARPAVALAARRPGVGGAPARAKGTLATAAQWLTLKNLRKYSAQIAAGAGVVVVIYGLTSAAYYVTSTLVHLSPGDMFELGLLTGGLAAAVAAGSAVAVYRSATISTQAVHRAALAKLNRSAEVRALLGASVLPGPLRAYIVHAGHVSVGGRRLGWVEPRVQMLVQLSGDGTAPYAEAYATIEAVKHKGAILFPLLAVDTVPGPGRPSQLVLVAGNHDKLHVRGTLRGFLQAERATFIPQDRVATDDDRLVEQEAMPAAPAADGEEQQQQAPPKAPLQ